MFGAGIAMAVLGILATIAALYIWYKAWNTNVPAPLPPAPRQEVKKDQAQIIMENMKRLDMGKLPYTLVDSSNRLMEDDVIPVGGQLLRGKWPLGLICLVLFVLNLIFIVLLSANAAMIRPDSN
jgi:hypothetical protein